ncbi:hypothetical protein [Burkholderia sp. Ac-20379]|uniref:hypothetical protein n=1 Tax=Burkholderia sp. Ac-20379 TaxID=2703900 RepID=UPI001981AF4A|nr:hypothetical protein [Burkholderia sp. Ac-20379]MBN3725564.1 hypothetical protein [Burkholderia sp. Ac-20379]
MPELRPWKDTAAATRLRFQLAAACAAVLLAILVAPHPLFFPLDDAYITIHNADVLLSGVDRNYGVPPLTGATSQIHLLLVAFAKLFLPSPAAAFAVSLTGIALYVAALARIAFQLGGSVATATLFVLLGTLLGATPYQLLNGLETGLAMAAVGWAISLALEPALSVRLPLLCGLMPFLRPEFAVLSGLLMLRQLGLRARAGGVAHAVRDALLAAAVALPFLAWTWLSLGTLFPATAKAKELFFADRNAPWDAKAHAMLVAFVSCGLMPLAIVATLARRSRLWAPLALFASLFVLALWLTLPAGMGHNYSRYLFVLLPAMLYLTLDALKASRWARVGCIGLAIWATVSLSVAIHEYEADTRLAAREFVSLADWLDTHLPHDATLLVHDAGYLSYATPFRLVDVVGLKTPGSIAFHRVCTAPTNGRDRGQAISAIALTSGARYAVIKQDTPPFWATVGTGLAANGWGLRELRAPSMPGGYAVFALTPPADTRVPCRP